MSPVVRVLLGANIGLFLADQMFPDFFHYWFALWPAGTADLIPVSQMTATGIERVLLEVPQFWPWQLVSYGFLHGSLTHLFFNMFALWMFATPVERTWGGTYFAIYYMVTVVGAGLVQLLVVSLAASKGGIPYPTVGASGGVFGILMAFAWMFPNQRIMLLFPPIPMKAKWFVLAYAGLELFLGVTGTQQGVAHFAHLGGLVFGFLTIQYWRGKLPMKPRRRLLW